MRVVFFGKLGERVGRSIQIELPTNAVSVGEVRALIADHFPYVRDELLGGKVRACVGDALVGDSFVVGPEQIVEFLPPVSGG